MRVYKNTIYLFLLLMINSSTALAQPNNIDQLQKQLSSQKEDSNKVNILNQLSSQYLNMMEQEKGRQAADQALALSEKINFAKGKAAALQNIGSFYETDARYDEARDYYYKAIEYFQQTKDKNKIADVYTSIASTYNGQENSSEALKNMYLALKIYDETGEKMGLAVCYLMIAGNNMNEKNYNEAEKNALAGLKLFEELNIKSGGSGANGILANIYLQQGKYDQALQRNALAIKLSDEVNDIWNKGSNINFIGQVYEKQADAAAASGNSDSVKANYNKALENYFSSVKLYSDFKRDEAVARTHQDIGRVYLRLGDFSNAEIYLQKSLVVFNVTKSKSDLEAIYRQLAKLDSAKGNFKMAYEHYKMYSAWHDSIIAQESSKKSMQYKMQYESDKKEAIAKAEQDKKEAEQKRLRKTQYLTIALLAVLILVFLLITFLQWKNNKQKKKANLLLTQQKEKIESTLSKLKTTQSQLIQSEKMASLGELTAGIAHEIQNPLNFVNNFSDVNSELIAEMKEELVNGNIEEAKKIADDIDENEKKIIFHGKRADGIVKGMLQHSRSNSGTKEPTNINALADEYLRLAYHGLRAKDKSFNATMKTDYDESIGRVTIIPQDIGRVILNLITNAFYTVTEKKKLGSEGYEPTVFVSTKRINKKVEISISDNGNGIPQKVLDKIFQPFFTTKPTGQGTGLGLSMSYDIVTKGHEGDLKVETKEGEGATFTIILPL